MMMRKLHMKEESRAKQTKNSHTFYVIIKDIYGSEF